MAIEIVSFPMNSMVDLSIVFCKRLPEGITLYQTWYIDSWVCETNATISVQWIGETSGAQKLSDWFPWRNSRVRNPNVNLTVCYGKSPLFMGKLTIMVSIWLSVWWFQPS